MNEIRKIVYLARTVRETHNIKHRHPLRKVSLGGLEQNKVNANIDLLKEELRVKEVEYLESITEYVKPAVKLNFPVLGPRLRGDIKKVTAAVRNGEYELDPDGAVLRVEGYELGDSEFSITYEPRSEDIGLAVDGELVVLLDLRMDDELVAEAVARDLNRRIQDLRKEADLGYTDRIVLSVVTDGDPKAALLTHGDWLAQECLATIQEDQLRDPLAAAEFELAGTTVSIALRRANTSLDVPNKLVQDEHPR